MGMRRALIAILLVLALPALSCVEIGVKRLPVGNYTLLKISYTSNCEGNLKIVVTLSGGAVYSASGNVQISGNRIVYTTNTFPSDIGGFEIKTVGPPQGEILVYLDGQLILRYILSGKGCLDYILSQAPYGMYYLGYKVPKNVIVIGITFINRCKNSISAKVSVRLAKGLKPLQEIDAIKCLSKKQYVEMVRRCIEHRCLRWTVTGYICSLRKITWHIEKGKIIKKEICLRESPTYACVHEICSKVTFVPVVREMCLRSATVKLRSTLEVSNDGFGGTIEIPPLGTRSAKLFVEGTSTEGVLAKVRVDGTEAVLRYKPVYTTITKVNWSVLWLFVLSMTLALLTYIFL